MANRPVSSSERKGVLIVAGIALIVTLCGLGVAWCGRPSKLLTPHDVEVLVDGDTLQEGLVDTLYVSSDSISGGSKTRRQLEESDSSASGKGYKKTREGKKRKKTEKEKKRYDRRSPLDEPV